MAVESKHHTNDTRSRLVRKASMMAQASGYEALSLQDLADELGIRKASIFHHFSSKDDLAVAVIENEIASFGNFIRQTETLAAGPRLTRYFDFYRDLISNGQVCPASAFAISWPDLSTRVQSALVRMHKQHTSFLDDVIHDGISTGDFTPVANATDLINALPDMLQGAIQVGRASSSAIPVNRLERIVLRLLNA
jgi:TetR/AcrR family transcriptional repressor of nem operon